MYFAFKYFCHKYRVIQRQEQVFLNDHQKWAVDLNSKKEEDIP